MCCSSSRCLVRSSVCTYTSGHHYHRPSPHANTGDKNEKLFFNHIVFVFAGMMGKSAAEEEGMAEIRKIETGGV